MRPALLGHVSPETAYVVEDYPYGFRLRCKIRYWIETTKHGQRAVSQTTNPKREGEVWNVPKKSTYNAIRVLYLDDEGHVAHGALSVYDDEHKIAAFLADHGEEMLADSYVRRTVEILRKIAARAKTITYTVKEG